MVIVFQPERFLMAHGTSETNGGRIMKEYTAETVVKHLIGSIVPYGDSTTDDIRLENIKEHIELTRELMNELIFAYSYIDRQEASINKIAKTAKRFLIGMKETLEYVLEDE